MLTLIRSRLTDVLFGVAATFVLGCGQGLFDRASVLGDAGEEADFEAGSSAGLDAGPPAGSDAGPPAGPEAGPDARKDAGPDAAADVDPDAGPISQLVDLNGAVLTLGEATLTIGSGTFRDPTQVTLRKLLSIEYAGAYGPVFEISVPSAGLFRAVAKLTLKTPVPPIGAQANLVLGTLDPSLSLADKQWIWVTDSSLSPDQTSVTGSVTGFGNASVLDFAVILRCAQTADCRSHEACNAGVCQQCPTSSVCAP